MKAILEFNLPEESEEHELALKGHVYKLAFDDIWEIMFRPRHKHGYTNEKLEKLTNTKTGRELMDSLEIMYQAIREENNV